MSRKDYIEQLPDPEFIDRNVDKITTDIIELYEQLSGKTLYPAQADRVFVDVIGYRESVIRTLINEAGKQNLLAFADGVMLDYIGDLFGVVRLDSEKDEQLRERIRLAPESYATTGSRQAYIYHALSTDSSIIDASTVGSDNGHVHIYILTEDEPSDGLLKAVYDNTNDDKKRPVSDRVHVHPAEKLDFELTIKVYPLFSANKDNVLAQANALIADYLTNLKSKLGQDIVPSQIVNLLSFDGVWQVEVISPSNSLVIEPYQVPSCTTSNITLGRSQNG